MTRAKVKVDPALRVVEVANGNPEEMTVSQRPLVQPFSEGERIWVTWCWHLRVKMVSEPRRRLCGRPKSLSWRPGPRGEPLRSTLIVTASFFRIPSLGESALL